MSSLLQHALYTTQTIYAELLLSYVFAPHVNSSTLTIPLRTTQGKGADLAVGANHIHPGGGVGPGVLGNIYVGLIGGLAFYATALTEAEIATLCAV
jgi:hypothetical protein